MYFLLFGFWVLLNGKWTTEIAIVGVIVCAALYAFMCAFMDYSPKKEWKIAKRFGKIVSYFFYLVGEVFKSAWATMVLIWSPDKEIEPRVTSFRTRLRTDAGKVVLANSITMTPGTITVDMQDDLFLIHCLDESFDVGTEGFEMEERVMHLEGGHDAAPVQEPAPIPEATEAPLTEATEEIAVLPGENAEVCEAPVEEIPQPDTQCTGDAAEKEVAQDE